MQNKRFSGFTLIELMIIVAIIGVIVAIAYPSYSRWVIQTKRSDAHVALSEIAARQEKRFTFCNAYTANLTGSITDCAAGGLGYMTTSPDGHYTLAITPGSNTSAGAPIEVAYTATATPAPGSSQVGDGPFRIDSTGLKQWNRKNAGNWNYKWTDK